MVVSSLALSLLGLGAVSALPTNIQERQEWRIGGPENGAIEGGGIQYCNVDAPKEEQVACIYPPITGTMNPSPKGKRDAVTFEPIGAFSSGCPDIAGAQHARDILLRINDPTSEESAALMYLTHFLQGCGLTISDESASFTLLPHAVEDDVNVPSLQNLYMESLAELGSREADVEDWAYLQGLADILEQHGVTVDRTVPVGGSALVARQSISPGPSVGCNPILLVILKTYYDKLWKTYTAAYGKDWSKWPVEARSITSDIYSTFQYCAEGASTSLTPGPYIPGGPIVPQPTVPGGSMNPDPTIPGGPMNPEPAYPGGGMEPQPTIPGGPLKPGKRGVSPAQEAFQILEKHYGAYSSGVVPSSISVPMSYIIADLKNQGFVIIGKPTTTLIIAP